MHAFLLLASLALLQGATPEGPAAEALLSEGRALVDSTRAALGPDPDSLASIHLGRLDSMLVLAEAAVPASQAISGGGGGDRSGWGRTLGAVGLGAILGLGLSLLVGRIRHRKKIKGRTDLRHRDSDPTPQELQALSLKLDDLKRSLRQDIQALGGAGAAPRPEPNPQPTPTPPEERRPEPNGEPKPTPLPNRPVRGGGPEQPSGVGEAFAAWCREAGPAVSERDRFAERLATSVPGARVRPIYRDRDSPRLPITFGDDGGRSPAEYWLVEGVGGPWLLPFPQGPLQFRDLADGVFDGDRVPPRSVGRVSPARLRPADGGGGYVVAEPGRLAA